MDIKSVSGAFHKPGATPSASSAAPTTQARIVAAARELAIASHSHTAQALRAAALKAFNGATDTPMADRLRHAALVDKRLAAFDHLIAALHDKVDEDAFAQCVAGAADSLRQDTLSSAQAEQLKELPTRWRDTLREGYAQAVASAVDSVLAEGAIKEGKLAG